MKRNNVCYIILSREKLRGAVKSPPSRIRGEKRDSDAWCWILSTQQSAICACMLRNIRHGAPFFCLKEKEVITNNNNTRHATPVSYSKECCNLNLPQTPPSTRNPISSTTRTAQVAGSIVAWAHIFIGINGQTILIYIAQPRTIYRSNPLSAHSKRMNSFSIL